MNNYLIIYKVESVVHYIKYIKAKNDDDAKKIFKNWRSNYADREKARKAKLIPLMILAGSKRQ
ncbi:MAG: hypothetical protein WC459_04130 [Patescibacteria group bacterium]